MNMIFLYNNVLCPSVLVSPFPADRYSRISGIAYFVMRNTAILSKCYQNSARRCMYKTYIFYKAIADVNIISNVKICLICYVTDFYSAAARIFKTAPRNIYISTFVIYVDSVQPVIRKSAVLNTTISCTDEVYNGLCPKKRLIVICRFLCVFVLARIHLNAAFIMTRCILKINVFK